MNESECQYEYTYVIEHILECLDDWYTLREDGRRDYVVIAQASIDAMADRVRKDILCWPANDRLYNTEREQFLITREYAALCKIYNVREILLPSS